MVLEGSDVGGPRPIFEPLEGASVTFDVTGGEQRVTVIGDALRKYVRAKWRADRALDMQRRDLLTVTGIASFRRSARARR